MQCSSAIQINKCYDYHMVIVRNERDGAQIMTITGNAD
jgi:hypothetical protein